MGSLWRRSGGLGRAREAGHLPLADAQLAGRQGAFAGYYRVADHAFEAPQLTNLIAPWQLMAAYDRYGDGGFLDKATQAANWVYQNMVETHPMSPVVGGVRDAWQPEEVWTKFTAEHVTLNIGLLQRTEYTEYLRRAIQSARVLVQAGLHDHATKYEHQEERWVTRGWQSFGRIIEAYLSLYRVTRDDRWLGAALSWGEFGLSKQAPDGGFYLINDEYYNSDIAADELRAFTFLYELTGLSQFRLAAERFADWHLSSQRPDGAWLLSVGRFGNPVSEYVGPGDVPNIAIALLRLHWALGDPRYLASALKAMRYALTRQVVPGDAQPFSEDEGAQWGYWSWDPYYDYTMSGDQVTHLVRGLWFMLDYLATLQPDHVEAIQAIWHWKDGTQEGDTIGSQSPSDRL